MTRSRNHTLEAIAQRFPLLRELPVEVTAVSAVAFCVALGFGIVGPVLPAFAREFNVTAAMAGLVVSGFAFMRLIAAPPAAWLLGRIGERKVLAWGLGSLAALTLLAGISQTYWQLLAFRGLSGIGSVMFSVSSLSMLLKVCEPDQRGRAASAWSGGFLLGGLTGPVLGGVFVSWSLRAPFFVYALTLTAGAFVAWHGLRHAKLHDADGASEEPPLTLREAVRDYTYNTVVYTGFANGFVRFGIINALPAIYVIEVMRQPAALVSVAFLLSSVGQAGLIGRTGRWTDSVGRKPMLWLGLTIAVLSQLVWLLEPSPILLSGSMLLLGVSGAFMSAAPSAVLGDLTGGRPRGPVLAMSQMASDLGGVLGPIAGGAVLDLTGSYRAAFGTGVAAFALAWVAVAYMRETRPTPGER